MPGKVLQKTRKCNVLEEKLSQCLGEIVYFFFFNQLVLPPWEQSWAILAIVKG